MITIISRMLKIATPGIDPDSTYWVKYEMEGLSGYWSIPEVDGATDAKAKAYLEARESEARENAENTLQDHGEIRQHYNQAMQDLLSLRQMAQSGSIDNWTKLNTVIDKWVAIDQKILKALKRIIVELRNRQATNSNSL